MFKNEGEFKKATGMNTLEFTRFIREKAAKQIDKELRRGKKLR